MRDLSAHVRYKESFPSVFFSRLPENRREKIQAKKLNHYFQLNGIARATDASASLKRAYGMNRCASRFFFSLYIISISISSHLNLLASSIFLNILQWNFLVNVKSERES